MPDSRSPPAGRPCGQSTAPSPATCRSASSAQRAQHVQQHAPRHNNREPGLRRFPRHALKKRWRAEEGQAVRTHYLGGRRAARTCASMYRTRLLMLRSTWRSSPYPGVSCSGKQDARRKQTTRVLLRQGGCASQEVRARKQRHRARREERIGRRGKQTTQGRERRHVSLRGRRARARNAAAQGPTRRPPGGAGGWQGNDQQRGKGGSGPGRSTRAPAAWRAGVVAACRQGPSRAPRRRPW